MGKPICITIPHTLGKAEARRRIEQNFADIQRNMGFGLPGLLTTRQQWHDDRLNFEVGGLGQKVVGRLDVLADAVQIELDLPEFLAALAQTVAAKLQRNTQQLLN